MDQPRGGDWREWALVISLFAAVSLLKVLLLAPGVYHSTDFEVHRNWLAVTYARPLKQWYWEETSEWTLDYPPFFGYFEWILAQMAVSVEPELVKIAPFYDPNNAAILFQRVSVIVADAALVFGVSAWSRRDKKHHNGDAECVALGALVLLNSGLIMVDHVHFQYNGFLLGVLLLSMGFIRQGRVLLGAAAFASLLMLKHLFLSLAPLYFVFLLRGYCCDITRVTNASSSSGSSSSGGGGRISNESDGRGETSQGSGRNPYQLPGASPPSGVFVAERSESGRRPQEASRTCGIGGKRVVLFFRRLAALGSVVLVVFGAALGPLCVSEGWTRDACARQLGQLAVRLFPFGRGLVHAYWAPNVWAIYLFADRMLLVALKLVGRVSRLVGTGSTTGGLVRTEVMGVLPAVPAGLCLLLSLIACCPALWRAWRKPSTEGFVWGVVHCSLSAFLVGFHVHEKALLVPAVASALLAFRSRAGARMYLRLSFLAAFAVFPLLPGPELRVLKVLLLTAHMVFASSLLQHIFPQASDKPREVPDGSVVSTESRADQTPSNDGFHLAKSRRISGGVPPPPTQLLWTVWDKTYVAGAVCVFLYGEIVHPSMFGVGREWLPFLPLMSMSVYGAVGVLVCWCESVMAVLRTV